jgi:hypothetical protein
MARPPDVAEALGALAGAMIQAGCEIAIGIAPGGATFVAMADSTPRLEMVRILREIADSFERDDVNLTAEVKVDTEDDA